MDVAGQRTPYAVAESIDAADFSQGKPVLVDYRGATQGPFERAAATAKGGRYCLDTLALALDAVQTRHRRCHRVRAAEQAFAARGGHAHQRRAALVCRAARLRRPGLRVQRARRPVDLARDLAHRAPRRGGPDHGRGRDPGHRADPPRAAAQRRGRPAHRGLRPQSAQRRQRIVRPRGDRHHSPRPSRRRALAAFPVRRPVRGRHDLPEGAGRAAPVRRRGDHVPRPGPDRDEAHGLLARRHGAGRPAVSHPDTGARHGVRHRRPGHRQSRRDAADLPAGLPHGACPPKSIVADTHSLETHDPTRQPHQAANGSPAPTTRPTSTRPNLADAIGEYAQADLARSTPPSTPPAPRSRPGPPAASRRATIRWTKSAPKSSPARKSSARCWPAKKARPCPKPSAK